MRSRTFLSLPLPASLLAIVSLALFLSIDQVHADIDISERFDPGFYDKIQEIINDEITGVPSSNGTVALLLDEFYNVIIYVTRHDQDSISEDTTQNKEKIVAILKEIGAKDIIVAKSLSFITANVPITAISYLATHNIVYQIGDGQEEIEINVDAAKKIVKGTTRDIPLYGGTKVTGKGVTVAVVDSGINSIYLNDKVTKRIYCPSGNCTIQNGLLQGTVTYDLGKLNGTRGVTHGTIVAQPLAATGMSRNNGIAPGVTLLDALWFVEYNNGSKIKPYKIGSASSFAHSLDWAYTQGADVINLSASSTLKCNPGRASTINLIGDELVEKGVIYVTSAGNYGLYNDKPRYNSVTAISCSHNAITVGGIDGRIPNSLKMLEESSRGPSNNNAPILKPDIVAPAVHLLTSSSPIHERYYYRYSGTSMSAPLVSGTMALMLESNPQLTPTESKALLLLGANWTGPVPCTSKQFEQRNPLDNCSFARQPTNKTIANNEQSLEILNNVGFGILNTQQAINYVNKPNTYISDYINNTITKKHAINITDTSKPVKIILHWLVHPPGELIKKPSNILYIFPFTDLNFKVQCASGQTLDATSKHQTSEFVVFQPLAKGKCDVTVTYSNITHATYIEHLNMRSKIMQQNYTIASTVPFVTSMETPTKQPSVKQPVQPVAPDPVNNTGSTRYAPLVKPSSTQNNSQTMSITIPQSMEYDTTGRTIDLYHGISDRLRIDTAYSDGGTAYHINDNAYITMFRDTWITNKQFTASGGQYCYVADLLVGQDADISIQHTNTLNLKFRQSTEGNRCGGSPSIDLDGKLVLGTEIYLRFVGTNGQTPFYYNGSNIAEIPKCSSANFDNNTNRLSGVTNQLIGDTEICYGKNGNDTILVSKILAVFGITTQDLSHKVTRNQPPPPQPLPPPQQPPVQTVNLMTQLPIQDYEVYNDTINGNNIDHEKIAIVHKMLPICTQTYSPIKQSVKLSNTSDLSVFYSSLGDFNGGTIFTTIKNDSGTFTAVSSNPTLPSTAKKFEYTNVISNNMINTDNDHLGIRSFFFMPSNVINSTQIFSNNSNGIPLFYKSGSIAVQLPFAVNGTTFVSGTLDGLTGTVYIPSDDTITLNEDVFCEFGETKPKQVAKIFDLNIKAKNVTQGLEVTYKFEKQKFQSGNNTVKEVRPNTLHWVLSNSNNTIHGNTTEKIKNNYKFIIPLKTDDVYDVIIYGTNKQEGKLLGVYRDSIKYVNPSPPIVQSVIPDPEPPPPQCEQGTRLVGDQCVPDAPPQQPPPQPPVQNTTQAETIQITIPQSMEYDTTGRTIDLYHGISDRLRIDTAYSDGGTAYHINDNAYITMFRDTWITNKQFTASGGQYCYVADLLVGQDADISIQHTNTLNLKFRQSTEGNRCGGSPSIDLAGKLVLGKEAYVRFVGTNGQVPFYYNGSDTTEILKCSSANFNNVTSQLIGDTETCYGKDGNDTILVSKILAIFGVTTQDLTPKLSPAPIVPTISITVPKSSEFDNTGKTIDLYHGISDRIRIDTIYQNEGTAYRVNDKAYITIFRDTWITNKQFTAQGGQYCYVGDLVVGTSAKVSKQHTNTLNISFRPSTEGNRCGGSPSITLDDKLTLSKEVYVRFVGMNGTAPFYYDGTSTNDIQKCTDANFDDTTNQLTGDTEICYGKDGNDAILVSKILAVFGV